MSYFNIYNLVFYIQVHVILKKEDKPGRSSENLNKN